MISKDAKIYVAGHRGLVGSAIYNNLKSKGYTNLIGRSHKELDLCDGQAVKRFFDEERPEYVVLAAAHVGGIMANSIYRADFIYINLQIQQNVIGESFRHGVKKLLFLGSTCIYPKGAPQPMSENALLTSELEYTNEPYAIAKIAGMKMCESFNLQYGTNYIAVMPTNLYGPNDNFHLENSHVMPAMMRKIFLSKQLMDGNWTALRRDLTCRPVEGVDGNAKEEDIKAVLAKYGIYADRVCLWGTGTPKREFLWSEDMADASVYLLENVDFADIIGIKEYSRAMTDGYQTTGVDRNKQSGRGGSIPALGEIRNCHINIGTGVDITLRELAEKIVAVVEYKGRIEFDSTKPDGVMKKLTEVSKLHSLGWRHKVEIDDGVRKLFDWYMSTLQ